MIPASILAIKDFPPNFVTEVEYIQDLAKRFCEQVVIPNYQKYELQIDEDPNFVPMEFMQAANSWGLYTLWVPKAFGGQGYNPASMHFFNEIVASHCMSLCNLIGVHYVGITILSTSLNFKLLKYVTEKTQKAQKTQSPKTLSIGITEPNAATDLEDIDLLAKADVNCIAKKHKNGYLLNGSKIFISCGNMSEWTVLSAFSDKKDPVNSQITFLVHKDTKGFSVGKIEKKMGQKACPAVELILEDVYIDKKFVIFSKDICPKEIDFKSASEAFTHDVLSLSRAGVGSISCGLAKHAINITEKYFDKYPHLKENEWAQQILAQMQKNYFIAQTTTLESMRTNDLFGPFKEMNSKKANYYLEKTPLFMQKKIIAPMMGRDKMRKNLFAKRIHPQYKEEMQLCAQKSSMAKSIASEMAIKNSELAMELLSNESIDFEWEIEKVARDARLLSIYEGSNQFNDLTVYNNIYTQSGEERFVN